MRAAVRGELKNRGKKKPQQEKRPKMDKTTQRKIWNENRGYAGRSRKCAYRRSKRAIRALRDAGISTVEFLYADRVLIREAAMAARK